MTTFAYLAWLAIMVWGTRYIDSLSRPHKPPRFLVRVLCDVGYSLLCGWTTWELSHMVISQWDLSVGVLHTSAFALSLVGAHVGARSLYQLQILVFERIKRR